MISRANTLTFALGFLLCFTTALNKASAQTDGNKATARALATEGLQLERDGKCEQALERLRRAQQLYDAPTHLLHIARCEAKLGHFLSASEAYQALLHKSLPDDAPAPFVEAQRQARQELPPVQARVPAVVLHVLPPNLQQLTITLDGNTLPDAVLGVPRFVNPGSHTVEAVAPGFLTQRQVVLVPESKRLDVSFSLQRDPNAVLLHDVAKRPVAPEKDASDTNEQDQPPVEVAHPALLVQARLLLRKPLGKMSVLKQGDETIAGGSVGDYFAYEAGVEIGVGLANLKSPFGFALLGGMSSVTEGTSDSIVRSVSPNMDGVSTRSNGLTRLYGGAAVTLQPCSGCAGLFAEFSFTMGQIQGTYMGEQEPKGTTCSVKTSWNTLSGRLVAGYTFGLGAGTSVGPVLMVEQTGVTSATFTPGSGCEDATEVRAKLDGGAGYEAITIGVHGQWSLGFGEKK